MQKKVGFAAVFINTTRRWAQSEKTSINTVKMAAIKIALKEIHKRWVIYTDSCIEIKGNVLSIQNISNLDRYKQRRRDVLFFIL